MNKKLIAILTLVMFAMTLLPMGAFAASVNTVTGTVGTFSAVATDQQMANLRISGDGVEGNIIPGVFTITLSSGIGWVNAYDGVDLLAGSVTGASVRTSAGTPVTAATMFATRATSGVLTIALDATTPTDITNNPIVITLPVYANITSVGTGDITATINNTSAGITDGAFTIGRFATGSVAASALNKSTRGDGTNSFGVIRFVENTGSSLTTGETITLRLPAGMTWSSATPSTVAGLDTLAVGAFGARTLTLTATANAAKSIIDVQTAVTINSSDAKFGDVEVIFGGSANLDVASVIIGSYKEFSATISAAEAKEIKAGKEEQKISTITLSEGLAGSILNNRTIKFTLPSGVKFTSPQTYTMTQVAGNSLGMGAGVVNSDRNEVVFTPATASTTSAAKYELKDVEIETAANFTGDVVINVTGTAGVSGKLTVATVKKAATVDVAKEGTLQIGKQNQEIPEIYVTESAKEIFRAGNNITLTLGTGANWSKIPTIEVVEGDLELGTATKNNNVLTIPVDIDSSVPSKIAIKGATVTLDRTVPEGDIKVELAGNAVVDTAFTNRNTADSKKIATVVTPAQEGVVQPVVMTVGSTVYTIDGVEMTMDVAPYIKDGRTYFPVRYVAQALGITADNVVWDGAQRTVTIFRANRIVQVTIGSTTMLVNGVPLTMDAAPEITAERTMLPIRFVAQGLGVNVNWDAATQTVTLN